MLARRSALTVARAGRFYSTASAEAGNEFLAQRAAVKEHAKGAYIPRGRPRQLPRPRALVNPSHSSAHEAETAGARCAPPPSLLLVAEAAHRARSSRRLTTGTTKLWRNVSFFVCIPVTILGSAWTWKLEKEHHEHLEHLKHENGGELPVRPDYEYLTIR
jgi:cytochrome c oxidase subunit 6a